MNEAPHVPHGPFARPPQRSALFLAGHGLYLALVLVFPFVMTYAMPPASFARLMVYLNLLGLLFDALNLGLARGLQQLAIQTPLDRLARTLAAPLRAALGALAATALAPVAILGLAASLRPAWFDGNGWLAFWIAAAVAIGLVRLCISSLLYGMRRFGWYLFMDQCWAMLRIVAVPWAWRRAGLEGALAAVALVWLASAVPGAAILARSGIRPAAAPWPEAWRALRYYWRLGFWMHAASMAASLTRPAAVLALAALLGRDHPAAGFLHLALSCFLMGAIMLDSLFLALYPEKARAGAQGMSESLARRAAVEACVLAYAATPLCWAGIGLLPSVVGWLRPDYHGVAAWMTPVILALPARAMAAPLVTALQAAHRSGRAAALQWIRLVLGLVGLAAGAGLSDPAGPAPAWGLLAGEWTATALAVWLGDRVLARDGASRRRVLTMTVAAAAMPVAGLLAAGGDFRWVLWLFGSGAWLALWPLSPWARAWSRRTREAAPMPPPEGGGAAV